MLTIIIDIIFSKFYIGIHILFYFILAIAIFLMCILKTLSATVDSITIFILIMYFKILSVVDSITIFIMVF